MASKSDRVDLRDITNFLKAKEKYPIPTREEEIELGKRIEQGDKEAFKELILSARPLVIAVARTFWVNQRFVSKGDLLQAGAIGIVRAAQNYDWRRGRFSTYATWWIKQTVQECVRDDGWFVRVPKNIYQEVPVYLAVKKKLTRKLDRDPTDDEIAHDMKVCVEHLMLIEKALELRKARKKYEFSDDKRQEVEPERDKTELIKAAKVAISESMSILSDREKQVIRLRYGLDGEEPHGKDALAKRLGVTPETARKAFKLALERLRAHNVLHERFLDLCAD